MMLTTDELISWTGFSVFEMWLHLVGLLLSTILFALKSYSLLSITYYSVFGPVFAASALDGYFLFIVFVRSVIEYKDCKGPILRFAFNWIRLGLLCLFEMLLCTKIEGELEHGQVALRTSYGIVFMPMWFLLPCLIYQTCKQF